MLARLKSQLTNIGGPKRNEKHKNFPFASMTLPTIPTSPLSRHKWALNIALISKILFILLY